jgi:hypothetical protein
MRHLKQLAAALAAIAVLGLAGCAAPASMESDAAIRKVAILTVLDESGPVNKVGLTVFQNDSLKIAQDGGLSRTAVETITQRLHQSRPAWQIVPAGVDLVALGEKYKDGIGTFTDSEGKLRPELDSILKRLDVDAVFLVTDSNITQGAAPGAGVGIALRKLPGLDAHVVLRAHVYVEMLDKSGTRLHGWGGGESALIKASAYGLTDDLASANTPEARASLSQAMRAELRRDVDAALQRMGY